MVSVLEANSIVHSEYVSNSKTAYQAFYQQVKKRLREVVRLKMPRVVAKWGEVASPQHSRARSLEYETILNQKQRDPAYPLAIFT
jgi:hypothetical protein